MGPGTCSAAAVRPRRRSTASKLKGDAAPRSPPVLWPASTACLEVSTASCGPFPDILQSAFTCAHTCSKVLAAQRTLHNNGAMVGPPDFQTRCDTAEEHAPRFSQCWQDGFGCGAERNTASDSGTHTHVRGGSCPDAATCSGNLMRSAAAEVHRSPRAAPARSRNLMPRSAAAEAHQSPLSRRRRLRADHVI